MLSTFTKKFPATNTLQHVILEAEGSTQRSRAMRREKELKGLKFLYRVYLVYYVYVYFFFFNQIPNPLETYHVRINIHLQYDRTDRCVTL